MKIKYFLAVIVAGVALANFNTNAVAADLGGGCPMMKSDGSMPQSCTAPTPGMEVNAAPVHWTTPAGWKELPATSIRIGNFLISGKGTAKAEVAVTSFPGMVGTEFDNINRWRGEVGLPALEPTKISSRTVTVDSKAGKYYEFIGASASTLVVALHQNGATWFFKMRGDKDVVDGAKASFMDFIKTVRFTGDAMEKKVASAVSMTSASGTEPNWNPPSTWVAVTAGPMVLKSFSVAGDNGQKAKVAVSVFPGGVGGALANVNRWRMQLGLAPITQAELPTATKTLHVVDGDAVLVELANAKAPGGALGMVAAIVPHNNNTWFYKLAGDETVVDREKDGFVKFVETVRYP